MPEAFDHPPDDSQVQAPQALTHDLAALFATAVPVPPAVDAAVLASARAQLSKTQPRAAVPHGRARTAIRWAVAAAAAAAAIFLLSIHLGPAREAAAPRATRPAPTSAAAVAKAKAPAAFDKADLNHDGRVDILDAFAVARAIEANRLLSPEWDFTGDGLVDRRDVDAIAHSAVRLNRGTLH